MFILPPELHQAIFHHLKFKQLVRAQTVCRHWREIILDSSVWPCSLYVNDDDDSYRDKWYIGRPDCTPFGCHDWNRRLVLQTLSKGTIKSLSLTLYYTWGDPGYIISDVLQNFVSLENLKLDIESISSRELTSILKSLPQITAFILSIDFLQDTPMDALKAIQLNLRRLCFRFRHGSCSGLNNIMVDIFQHSPDLVSLAFRDTAVTKELTMKLGDGIQCLALCVTGKLPPISASRLKCLRLVVRGPLKHEPFEEHPCNLSHLTHLQIHHETITEQLSILEAYNIGETLEFLSIGSEPNYEVFLRTPKLKELRMIGPFPLPPDVCPILEKVYYGPHHYMNRNGWQETMYDLKSRDITVLYHHLLYDQGPQEEMFECFVCGESHT
jgi:hypothetical protein